MVPIPEGEAIVTCPFCELRSVVSGERGVRRYQVPTRITREQAEAAYKRFLSSNLAIARSAASQAQISEVLLVHLPFWAVWGQVAAGCLVTGASRAAAIRCPKRSAWLKAWPGTPPHVMWVIWRHTNQPEGRPLAFNANLPHRPWCLSRWVQPKAAQGCLGRF